MTDAEIDSACLSYRHDFGLLSKPEKDRVRFECREWVNAISKARPSPKVRKLLWKRVADNSWVSGSYTITEKREKFNVTFYTGPVQGLMAVGMREGLESAQAAAQADYKARILGALE